MGIDRHRCCEHAEIRKRLPLSKKSESRSQYLLLGTCVEQKSTSASPPLVVTNCRGMGKTICNMLLAVHLLHIQSTETEQRTNRERSKECRQTRTRPNVSGPQRLSSVAASSREGAYQSANTERGVCFGPVQAARVVSYQQKDCRQVLHPTKAIKK